MKNDIKKAIFLYWVADFLAASASWFAFLYYRQYPQKTDTLLAFFQQLNSKDIVLGLIIMPFVWSIFHLFSGAYFNPYRKSRIVEIFRTVVICLLGTVLVSLFALTDDIATFNNYYIRAFFAFLLIQFAFTSLGRIIVLNRLKSQLKKGRFGFNTLLIGGNKKAISLYKDITENPIKLGYSFKGFVYADPNGTNGMSSYLPQLGSINDLEKIIDKHEIEEVIIAVDTSEHGTLEYILSQLSHRNVVIKITPDLYDIISGSVKTSNVFGAVLIEIYPELMPDWQRVCKRALDIIASFFVFILLSPLMIFAAMKVKWSSPGPVLYRQSRIGLYGKPFWIYKFRSMVENAEDSGPRLSSENDPRITKWGKFMRKWRIDELPQFFNILKGDMTLVGPRPERKYFIDIISQTHPHYKYLHQVKPGLTSWGMVKFGYAENTNEMIERMRYDLLYIKNCSMGLDIKIMLYTILVILQGRGK